VRTFALEAFALPSPQSLRGAGFGTDGLAVWLKIQDRAQEITDEDILEAISRATYEYSEQRRKDRGEPKKRPVSAVARYLERKYGQPEPDGLEGV
jgi:hypothetical protein